MQYFFNHIFKYTLSSRIPVRLLQIWSAILFDIIWKRDQPFWLTSAGKNGDLESPLNKPRKYFRTKNMCNSVVSTVSADGLEISGARISKFRSHTSGIILCMGPTNERQHYIVTLSLIAWAHTQNDLWYMWNPHLKIWLIEAVCLWHVYAYVNWVNIEWLVACSALSHYLNQTGILSGRH